MAGWKSSDERFEPGPLQIESKRQINYESRAFRLRDNSSNGEAGSDTLFLVSREERFHMGRVLWRRGSQNVGWTES